MRGWWFSALVLVIGCKDEPVAPAAPASRPVDPATALAALDGRIPVPMPPPMAHHHRQNMREHLEVVQGIVLALAADDFSAVEAEAKKIAASEKTAHQCDRMGRGAVGFTEQALRFHEAADGIVAAAARRDRAAVLTSLGETIAVCTGCHAAYRQEVVDWAAYEAASARR